jgi:AcrR family transcriptional regulator
MRPDKRDVILDGALELFARDGFTRAGMDAVAAHAGVSVRTIYNHFPDKATLFHTVMTTSARRVAAAHIAAVHRHLGEGGGTSATGDLEADLVSFGCAWVATMPEFAHHFALVEQVRAEARHIPPGALEDWKDAGPRPVRRAVAARLQCFAAAGLLRPELRDPEAARLAALQFALLLQPADRREDTMSPAEVRRVVAAAVHTFLHGNAV